LPKHLYRRLDRDDEPIDRLIRACTGIDVQHAGSATESGVQPPLDPWVGTPEGSVAHAGAVVERSTLAPTLHLAESTRSTPGRIAERGTAPTLIEVAW
jgi:hypothetical protein